MTSTMLMIPDNNSMSDTALGDILLHKPLVNEPDTRSKKSGDKQIDDDNSHNEREDSKINKVQRRVKVYLLNDDSWLDHGTGFCSGEIDSESNKPYFLVKNELNPDEIILKAFLEGTTQYQRQQDTLIVWTDPSGKDIALSFQETEGCADLCDFIIKMQQENISPEISLYYVISGNQVSEDGVTSGNNDITELITGPITYPDMPCSTNLDEILEIFNQCSASSYSRSCILKFLVQEDYLTKLIDVFHESEAKHKLMNLFSLSEIIKTLILYSESSIIQELLSTEEKLLGVISILEYDAEFPQQQSCHRQFLKEKANFKMIINLPLNDDKISKLNMFKKDFYYNFLKDVILARFIDDQTFNLLNTLIHLNQVEILEFLRDSQKNDNFLGKLFSFYQNKADENVDVNLQRDGVKLLHQYVLLTKNLIANQRTTFFADLIQNGLLDMIKYALNDEDVSIKVLGTELIVSIIEQDVSLVNSINDGESSIDNSEPPQELQAQDTSSSNVEGDLGLKLSDDMTLLTLLSQLILENKYFGLKTQAFEALKILLDQNIGKIDANGAIPDYAAATNTNNDISTEDYFKAFYTEVAPLLYENLIKLGNIDGIPAEIAIKIKEDELLYQKLCELFSFCILTHDKFLQRSFFIKNNILLGITKILQMNCKMALKLSVVGCLSNVLAFNDKFYTKFILNHKVIDLFFDFFKQHYKENNLANSTCLSLLETLSEVSIGKNKVNFRLLMTHIYNNYKSFCINDINYVETGAKLIKLYDQLDPSNASKNTTPSSKSFASGDINTDGDVVEENEVDEDEDEEVDHYTGDMGNRGNKHKTTSGFDPYDLGFGGYDDNDDDDDDENDDMGESNEFYLKGGSSKESEALTGHKDLFQDIQKEFESKKEKRQRDEQQEQDKISTTRKLTKKVSSHNGNGEDKLAE